jgi:hypothetical protein
MSVETHPAVRTPPAQMGELDFLLGHHRCVGRTSPEGSAATVMYLSGQPTLGGHYYNVDIYWPGVMAGRWVFGWNPLDQEYNIYYLSDSGTQGVAVSAGWQDGEFAVSGAYTVVEQNAHKKVKDVFTKTADGTFTVHSFVWSEKDDVWRPIDVFQAHRMTDEQAREEIPDDRH